MSGFLEGAQKWQSFNYKSLLLNGSTFVCFYTTTDSMFGLLQEETHMIGTELGSSTKFHHKQNVFDKVSSNQPLNRFFKALLAFTEEVQKKNNRVTNVVNNRLHLSAVTFSNASSSEMKRFSPHCCCCN